MRENKIVTLLHELTITPTVTRWMTKQH